MNRDLEKPFILSFAILKRLGMWQDGQQSWTYFFVGYTFHIITISVYIIGCVVCIYKEFRNFVTSMEAVSLLACVLGYLMKSVNLMIKIRGIKKCKKNLETLLEFSADDRLKSRDKLRAPVDFAYKVYTTFLMSIFLTCSFGILIPIFTNELPYKIWSPYQNTSIGLWSATIYLTLFTYQATAINMTLDMMPGIFLTFAIGLIDELCERLEKIGKDEIVLDDNPGTSRGIKIKTKKNKEEEFIRCVEIQKKIKKFVSDIEDNFSLSIIIQGFISSVILCTLSFILTLVSI